MPGVWVCSENFKGKQFHSTPISWSILLRNLILAGIAGFVVGFGRTMAGLGPFDWLGVLVAAQRIELLLGVLLLVLLVLEGRVLFQIMRQQGRLLLRFEALEAQLATAGLVLPSSATKGLPVGSSAPTFCLALLSLSGQAAETITLKSLQARGWPVVLVFTNPDCGPCRVLYSEIGRWQREYASKLTLALVSQGAAEANRKKVEEHDIALLLLQQNREVEEAYQVDGTPECRARAS
jgi:hypothetical protein